MSRPDFYIEDTPGHGLGAGVEQSPSSRFLYIRVLRWHFEWRWAR